MKKPLPDDFPETCIGPGLFAWVARAQDYGYVWPDDFGVLTDNQWEDNAMFLYLNIDYKYRINPASLAPVKPRVGIVCVCKTAGNQYSDYKAIELTPEVRAALKECNVPMPEGEE